MSFSDAQARSIILGIKAQIDSIASAGGAGASRLMAASLAMDAIGTPTAAPGGPGDPPPTNPFPPTSDPSHGSLQVIRWAAYSPQYSGAEWAKVKDSPLTLRLDT